MRVPAVHPHVRGALAEAEDVAFLFVGPSPRAWGSHKREHRWRQQGRSIPTCVGLSVQRSRAGRFSAVHPHVRGALTRRSSHSPVVSGPSPRAWGSLRGELEFNGQNRSIPTCVGLSTTETTETTEVAGPSPRAWGSHPHRLLRVGHARSIPTCVGLSSDVPRSAEITSGPSPRAWGSRRRAGPAPSSPRSIPTCVGLSISATPPRCAPTVHPHVRGALSPPVAGRLPRFGPSPRAWGSR